MTPDEACTANVAGRKLLALYQAYRATSRAHLVVLARMQSRLPAAAAGIDEVRDLAAVQALAPRAALARETYAVFGVRAEQVWRRLLELRRKP